MKKNAITIPPNEKRGMASSSQRFRLLLGSVTLMGLSPEFSDISPPEDYYNDF
jgi:hypothetical protein